MADPLMASIHQKWVEFRQHPDWAAIYRHGEKSINALIARYPALGPITAAYVIFETGHLCGNRPEVWLAVGYEMYRRSKRRDSCDRLGRYAELSRFAGGLN